MPSVADNKNYWDGIYDWSAHGEEWSEPWGGSDMQFFGCILPRIRRYMPTGTILELAVGYGRWTQYLLSFADEFIGVDLSEECIAYCHQRFSHVENARFYTNDGTSLDMIPDGSVDFAISFDSFVHVDISVIESYLAQLKRKLTPNGVGFFHHSNFRSLLDVPNLHWRDHSVNHQVFWNATTNAGLSVVSQELINWRSNYLTDCFSVFTQRGSHHEQEYRLYENPKFMEEAEALKRLSTTYRR